MSKFQTCKVHLPPLDVFAPFFTNNTVATYEYRAADRALFYYAGVSDLVAISIEGTLINFYVPPGNNLQNGFTVISSKAEKIYELAQIHFSGNVDKKWFVFDLRSERILETGSFMDYVSLSSTGKSVFVLEKDGKIVSPIYYLSDQTTWGNLSFSLLAVAKRDMIRPTKGKEWTTCGKKLLSFLLNRLSVIPYDFSPHYGPWTSMQLEFVDNVESEIGIAHKKLNLQALRDLGSGIIFPEPEKIKGTESGDPHKLSTLIELGVTAPVRFSEGIIDFEIDIRGDSYKKVTYYPKLSQFSIWLNHGQTLERADVSQELGLDPDEFSLHIDDKEI